MGITFDTIGSTINDFEENISGVISQCKWDTCHDCENWNKCQGKNQYICFSDMNNTY